MLNDLISIFYKINKEKAKKEFDYYFGSETKGVTVEIDKATKVYPNGIKAVNRASIKIKANEFICLLGPSGCGKTTILRMIAGLESISSGIISFDSNIINDVEPGRRELSMVFQNYALYPFMSVYKNIAFGLKIKAVKNHVYLSKKAKIKKLKNIIKYNNKIYKHEIKMLNNLNYEAENEVKTALKLKKKSKNFDNEYSNLKLQMEDIRNESKKLASSPEHKNRISVLKLATTKYKKYLYSEELSKLDFLNDDKGSDFIIGKLKQKSITDLKKTKLENKKKVKELRKQLLRLAIVYKSNIPNIIEEMTSLMGINSYLNRKPAELSGGQRQRVALSRAISKNSGLFLYDEPLSNLDAKLRAVMRREIRQLHEKLGATSVYVTHDQIEAMTMADRIVVMNSGYIQQIGTPIEIYDSPANLYVATFVGSPEMNIINCVYVDKNTISINGKNIKVNRKIKKSSNSKIILGIRPEHIIHNEELFDVSKENVLLGKVVILEPTGKSTIVHVETEIGIITSIFDTYQTPMLNTSVKILLNPSRIHIFDSEVGISLTSSLNEETQRAQEIWIKGTNDRVANQIILHNEKNKLSITGKINKFILSPLKSPSRRKFEKEEKVNNINKSHTDKTLVERYFDSKK